MDELIFLGTGGARVMLSRQLLATAGIWMQLHDTKIHLDPGPGALLHAMKHRLHPSSLDGIILSHRHLDHCGDANAMIEAMTHGGLHKKGRLYAPPDALDEDPVVLRYLRPYLEEINRLETFQAYKIGNISFRTSMPLKHGVTTYGMIFDAKSHVICYIPDTKYFPELKSFFEGSIFIISMLRKDPHHRIAHLAVKQVEELLDHARPELTILTHFGMQIYQEGPHNVAREISLRTGLRVLAAHDGFRYKL